MIVLQKYLHKFFLLLTFPVLCFLVGCKDELSFQEEETIKKDNEVVFVVNTHGFPDTRGVEDESKREFETGELLHIRGEYDCSRTGSDTIEVQYGVLKYSGKGQWTALDDAHSMHWPDDAVKATFSAYYLHGSTDILSEFTMEPKLLSSYAYGEDPLHGEAIDVSYGATVRLEMYHIFSHLTLTEMNNAVPSELWFAVPKKLRWTKELNGEDEPELNNAFYLEFDKETKKMTPVFTAVYSDLYKDEGENLSYIEGITEQYGTEDGSVMTRVSYFLEPRKYHHFSLLYARSHTEYSSYLSYTRNLVYTLLEETKTDSFVPNGRYEFSILKSLGVVVEQEPDDNWDEKDPVYITNVEEFLKAAANGQEYWESDQENHDIKIQILEPTMNGTRLLENIDFHNEFYNDVFEDGYVPNLSNTFDGNYHYIYNLGSPLFNTNQGNIINLGIRNAKINNIESNERFQIPGRSGTYDTSYNGLIACRNSGSVRNIRLIGAEMTISIRTSAEDNDQRTQEAHNAALLFGENSGSATNIFLADDLKITVKNAEDETIVPNVMIGGIAGQNLGTISGVSSLNDDKHEYKSPAIFIVNECNGVNGVYLVGGVAGLSPGTLNDIILSKVDIDARQSSGVEARMGGIVGEIPNSNTGAPQVNGCIIRGNITGGSVKSLTNVTSLAYTGGFAGSMNLQAIIVNNSVSFSINASTGVDTKVTYATGGAFGRIERSVATAEGSIELLAAFGTQLTGMSNYIGNFAGIVPRDYNCDFSKCKITVKNFNYNDIGAQM